LHHVANLSFSACDAIPLCIPSYEPYVYIIDRNFTLLTAVVIIAWRYWCGGTSERASRPPTKENREGPERIYP
jgi:hypothetical protein